MARTRILLACLTLAAPLVIATPATAATQSALLLGVHQSQGSFGLAYLKCEPVGGTHSNATKACADIDKARGDFTKLPGRNDSVLCTMEFNETAVAAQGKWRGKKVDYRETFPNPCLAHAATSDVFRFSD